MPLVAAGISHHTASLDIRERVAFGRDAYEAGVRGLCAEPGIEEAMVLSTCNRTELYCAVRAGHERAPLAWLQRAGGLPEGDAEGYFYLHTGPDAVRHLFRVACGLDSLVLGEPQIIGQLKDAWLAARAAGGAGKFIDRLCQRAFAASKEVRSATGINEHPVSAAYITCVLARQIFGDLTSKTVLLVGAGEMIELCGRHLHQQGVQGMLIANRSLEKAQRIAKAYGARALALDTLEDHLAEADILIASTASTEPVVTLEAIRRAIRARRRRPVFMVDLGVPRDIAPEAGRLDDVYLYTIDDLQQVVDENRSRRHQAAEAAQDTIDAAIRDYLRWLHGTRAADSLRRIRQAAEVSGRELADRALHRIEAGADPGAVIEQLANTLTHRILHGPSTRLRQAAEQREFDILEAADWLFEPTNVDAGDVPEPPDEEDGT